jgi:micrococcal nuclease
MQILVIIVAVIVAFVSGGVFISNIPKQSPTPSIANVRTTPTFSPTINPAQNLSTTTNTKTYSVIQVVDGDTIKVSMNGEKVTIRLIGVDTPETVDPRKPVQCFGKEATNKIIELLRNKIVVLEEDESQGDKDKYGRLLRYIFLPDGTNVNKALIQEGYAYEYTYRLPYKYQGEFKEAQISARENKRGLWADNACVTPTP